MSALQKNWHRILLLLALGALVASLALVAMGFMNTEEDLNLQASTRQPQPELDMANYEEKAPKPLRIDPEASQLVLKSPERFTCVHQDCQRPVVPQEGAYNCPFCRRPQPNINERDDDQDGIRKGWELAAGLNDFNPDDALLDKDGDLFTNLEEYWYGEQEDPDDPEGRDTYNMDDANSHPRYGNFLTITNAQTKRRRFAFKSASKGPQNSFSFGIQIIESDRTYPMKIGDEVNGYQLIEYDGPDATIVLGEDPVIKPFDANNKQKKVVKIKELETDRIIELEIYRPFVDRDMQVELTLLKDPSIKAWLKEGETMTVRDEVYELISIDRSGAVELKLQGTEEVFVARIASDEQRVEISERKDGSWEPEDPRGTILPGDGFDDDEEPNNRQPRR